MASKLYIRAEHRNNDADETIKSTTYQATITIGDQSINQYRIIAYSQRAVTEWGKGGLVNPDLHESWQVRASRQLKAGNITSLLEWTFTSTRLALPSTL